MLSWLQAADFHHLKDASKALIFVSLFIERYLMVSRSYYITHQDISWL